MSSPLAELFPDGEHRFHLTLRRAEPRAWFAHQDTTGRVLAERRRWLQAEPSRYAALLPEARPLLDEFAEVCRVSGYGDSIHAFGARLEPDVLLLSSDAARADAGEMRLLGGALCFPTGWALEEKLGQPLDVIHGVVPGLNPAIGASIRQLLAHLKPGIAFCRDNWGLAATDELNLHPSRHLPPPAPPVAMDRLWLRVEHQALVALPRSGGIAFGIRIALHRLDEVARDPTASAGLAHALATMPPALAAYKRIDRVHEDVTRLLSTGSPSAAS